MTETVLIVVSGSIVVLLGTAHLALTYRGPKLMPRDRELVERMRETHLVITTQTTVERAWIGFNASHGMGAIVFGFTYSYLALAHPEVFFTSIPLQSFGFAVLMAYLVLAKLYWFTTPLAGVGVSLLCYASAIVLAWT